MQQRKEELSIEESGKITRFVREDWKSIRLALLVISFLVLGVFLISLSGENPGILVVLVLLLGVVIEILHYQDKFQEPLRKFWRGYRWIIISGLIIVLIWLGSNWLQSSWSVRHTPVPQHFSASASAIQGIYPNRILYNTTPTPSVSLWWECNTNACAEVDVELSSPGSVLLFALDGNKKLSWDTTLQIRLPKNGAAVQVLIVYLPGEASQNIPLELTVIGSGEVDQTQNISFEGAWDAQMRRFRSDLANGIGVVLAFITAAFAAVKQLAEQKRSERKKDIDKLLEKVDSYQYERGKVKSFLDEIDNNLHDWMEWYPEQRKKLKDGFGKLVDTVIEQSKSPEHYSPETSLWVDKAASIAEKTGLEPSTIEKIKLQQQKDPPGYASLFPPEAYPLQKRFVRHAQTLPEEGKWGISDWEMRFAPFGDDLDTPFRYKKEDDFPLLAAVNFGFDPSRFSNQTYGFQNSWDLRAGYYQYCRIFNSPEWLAESRRTFFVPALPEAIPMWIDPPTFDEGLLHNLAKTWIRVLANAPDMTDKGVMELLDIEALARLIVWHYGSPSAIKVLALPAESQIMRHIQVLGSNKDFPAGERSKWLALRPPKTDRTLYLYAQVSPAGRSDKAESTHLTDVLSQQLLDEKVSIARFMLAKTGEPGISPEMMKDGDLLNLLNERMVLAGCHKRFEDLFSWHPNFDDRLQQFLQRANGSPGTILRMAHQILEHHQLYHPLEVMIDPDVLGRVMP